MYIYQIIDNRLVSKGKTNFIKTGIIENFKEGYNSYELAYITEDDLQVKLPNNEYKYYIGNGELKEVEFAQEAWDEIQIVSQRDNLIRSKIREIYTVDEEFKLINLGIADNTDTRYIEYRANIERIKGEV